MLCCVLYYCIDKTSLLCYILYYCIDKTSLLCCILYYCIDKTSLLCCILYYCIDKTSLLCYILYYCIDKTSLLNKLQTLNLNIVRPFYTLYTLHSDTILCNFTKTNKHCIRLHTNSTVYTIISFGWQTRSNFNRYNLTLPSPGPPPFQ